MAISWITVAYPRRCHHINIIKEIGIESWYTATLVDVNLDNCIALITPPFWHLCTKEPRQRQRNKT